jgi:hypothetical protein
MFLGLCSSLLVRGHVGQACSRGSLDYSEVPFPSSAEGFAVVGYDR